MDFLDHFLTVPLSEIRHLLGASCYLGGEDECHILSTLRTCSLFLPVIIINTVRLGFGFPGCICLSLHFGYFFEERDSMCFSYHLSMECGRTS